MHKALYECECPHLNRALPFRTTFHRTLINDIIKTCDKNQVLTLVSVGPGGFLFDYYVIKELIKKGYTLAYNAIEPLKDKESIALAYQELITLLPDVRIHLFKNWNEYAQACNTNEKLKANCLICVDPDDITTQPDFNSDHFREQFTHTLSQIAQKKASFYYLFYQEDQEHHYRHMIIGRWSSAKDSIAYEHHYGEESLTEQKKNRVFLHGKELHAFKIIEHGIQYDEITFSSPELTTLLENPLDLF